jgi:hypothetical protein
MFERTNSRSTDANFTFCPLWKKLGTTKSNTLMPAFKRGPESRILLLEPCKKCADGILPLRSQNVPFPSNIMHTEHL